MPSFVTKNVIAWNRSAKRRAERAGRTADAARHQRNIDTLEAARG